MEGPPWLSHNMVETTSLISSLRLPKSTFKEPPAVVSFYLKYSFPSPPPAPDSGFEPLFPRCGSVLQVYGNFRRWYLVGGSRSPGMRLWGSQVAGSLLGSLLPRLLWCEQSLHIFPPHKLCHPRVFPAVMGSGTVRQSKPFLSRLTSVWYWITGCTSYWWTSWVETNIHFESSNLSVAFPPPSTFVGKFCSLSS